MDKKNRLNKSMIYGAIDAEKAQVEHMKKIQDMNVNGSREKFVLGENWFKSGLPFEEAPIELQKNISFKNGFERGKRLELIESLQNGKSR